MKRTLRLLAAGCLLAGAICAQDNPDLLARMRAMEERIQALETELAALKAEQGAAAAAPAVAAATPAPAAAAVAVAAPASQGGGNLSYYGGSQAAASKIFNPDISVIGDFIGAGGRTGPQNLPSFQMHESEVGYQAILDPYARADFFISFGEHGVDLEEGYLTFPALPGSLQLRAGKMRSAFGKINTLHNHVLPWIDRPLVSENLIGGEEGISDAGLSVSRILPSPESLFLEATAQVFRGDSGSVFQAYRRNDVSIVDHLRAYHDLSESTNLDMGFSYARGSSPVGPGLINQLYDIDATVRWKPLRRAIYRSFVGRAELVWDRNDRAITNTTPFGYFLSGDYQFGRRWFAGGRFDWSERATSARLRDRGGSLVLTYWPSEFSQVRAQLRRTSYAEGQTSNEILFQFLFSIGAHGAHPF